MGLKLTNFKIYLLIGSGGERICCTDEGKFMTFSPHSTFIATSLTLKAFIWAASAATPNLDVTLKVIEKKLSKKF